MKIGLPAGTADPSAVLDISNTGSSEPKGFLGPQVALTSNNTASPFANPATGLIVYNTVTAGVTPNDVSPGYYYWNGSLWVLFAISTTTAPITPNNIYSMDNTLTGNRTVGLGNYFLNFTGGNVGIRNSNPTVPLDVTGRGKFSSDVLINGITVGLGGTAAVNNTIFGSNSGLGNTTGTFNTYSGFHTGMGNTTGSFNAATGANALAGNTTGANNSIVGYNGMVLNSTGYNNVAVGSGAGATNTTGFGNVFLGYHAGETETGSNKLYIQNTTTAKPLIYGDFGTGLLGIGFKAPQTALHAAGTISSGIPLGGLGGAAATNGILKLYNLTNANSVSIKGGITTASYTLTLPPALPIGNQLLSSDVSGNLSFVDNGAFSWSKAGNTGTTDLDNFLGNLDNIPLNFRVNNTRVGRIDGATTSSTYLGYLAGNATTGVQNTAIGANSQKNNTTGSFNFSGGVNALLNNSTGANNVAAGYNSLQANTTGYLNVALGSNAGFGNITGFGNVFLGNSAGYNETGNNNLYISNNASAKPLVYGDFGTNKLGIGFTAPQSTFHSSGTLSVGIPLGGLGGTTANDGTINFYNATNANIASLKSGITTTPYAITLPLTLPSANQLLMGDIAGNLSWVDNGELSWSKTGNTGISDANFIGTINYIPFNIRVNNQKAARIDPASLNTYFGYLSGSATTGTNNTGFGASVLSGNTTGANNASYGFNSLNANTTGYQNFAGGANALPTNTTGYNNTVVGANSGEGIVTGNNNTILGANVTGLLGTLSNNIIIADGIGNQRINIDATGNVGLGTMTPGAALDVASTTKGALLPRMTKAQRNLIVTPPIGSIIYQTDNIQGLRVWNGTNWMKYTESAD